ncbi:MAG: hypothetical protein QXK37_05580 [Candidatus Woesearchaeota archaeon]
MITKKKQKKSKKDLTEECFMFSGQRVCKRCMCEESKCTCEMIMEGK